MLTIKRVNLGINQKDMERIWKGYVMRIFRKKSKLQFRCETGSGKSCLWQFKTILIYMHHLFAEPFQVEQNH